MKNNLEILESNNLFSLGLLYFAYIFFLEYTFIYDVSIDIILLSGFLTFLFTYSISSFMKKDKNLKNFYNDLELLIEQTKKETGMMTNAEYLKLWFLSLLTLGFFKFHRNKIKDALYEEDIVVTDYETGEEKTEAQGTFTDGMNAISWISGFVLSIMIFSELPSYNKEYLEDIHEMMVFIAPTVTYIFILFTTVNLLHLFFDLIFRKKYLNMYISKQDDFKISEYQITNLYQKHNLSLDAIQSVKTFAGGYFVFSIPFLALFGLLFYIFGGFSLFDVAVTDISYADLFNKTTTMWEKDSRGFFDLVAKLLWTVPAIIYDLFALPFLLIWNILVFIIASIINLVIIVVILLFFFVPVISGFIIKLTQKEDLANFVQAYLYISYLSILFLIAFL